MTSIIVSGPLANKPRNGGIAWNVLSYVLGLKRLGHNVYFLETIDPATCVDDAGAPATFDRSINRSYFHEVTQHFGITEAALICDPVSNSPAADTSALVDEAEVLVNVSGHLAMTGPWSRIPTKIYIDEDPGYTQYWYAAGVPGLNLAGHDHYFTVGENIGRPGCPIPTGGIAWRPTRQPVVLDEWPDAPVSDATYFTTVASWRGAYGPVEFEGRRFGLKVHEFRKFLGLPSLVDATFEIALDIGEGDHADREALQCNGWRLTDPVAAASDPVRYREYLQGSSSEFSVAQGIYVDTDSGWFSDRSARYLASGKPVLVQDTAFGRNIPVGEGICSFRTIEEAVAGANAILEDYERHSRAARRTAESCFDSDVVLRRLLEQTGVKS